ncbi:hypothetical protein [Sphingomonas piscis]|uniref:hypothetical protein n=1 Tax=Sphingomonas piscis TaxID=2714943 RepID=UPI0019CF82BD|nr:hypothetical protein [Sphingomonas piscis]
MSSRKSPGNDMKPNNALKVEQTTKETGAQAMARKLLQPTLKNAAAASAFTGKMLGSDLELPGIGDYADHVHLASREAANGNLIPASEILAAQAITLDSMFAELARRAALNMGEYINAAERYGRLAIKAQSNCRATLEALAKLHQPREQTVRHVHVNEGAQAVIADRFYNQHRGHQVAEAVKQPHAAGTSGPGGSPTVLSHDASCDPLQSSGNQGCKAMPNARRQR